MESKKYFLSLLAIVKNESLIISEWIDHYMWQGVEHFYIIDNGSTDFTKEKLQVYMSSDVVSYFYKPEKYKQVSHYNDVFHERCKNETQWLIVCDVDEYIYHRHHGKKISDFLVCIHNYTNVCNIALRWKMFGSSGYDVQPENIRTSFVHRNRNEWTETKHIVNTDLTDKLEIHWPVHPQGSRYIILISPQELALNHYAIMSKEYFATVKMVRGDVSNPIFENVRDWDYFKRYDYRDEEDYELCNLVSANIDIQEFKSC